MAFGLPFEHQEQPVPGLLHRPGSGVGVGVGRLLELARQRYVPPSSLAAVHLALGEKTLALDALDGAYLTRDTRLTFLKDDPRLTGLRQEPRFIALLQRLRMDRFGVGLAPI